MNQDKLKLPNICYLHIMSKYQFQLQTIICRKYKMLVPAIDDQSYAKSMKVVNVFLIYATLWIT